MAAARDIALRDTFDLIAITGDVTSFGKRSEFAAAEAWITALPSHRLITPGNHDTPYSAVRLFAPFARYAKAFGDPDHAAFDAPGLAARSFNTARGIQIRTNWSKGCVNLDDVDRVVASLAGRPAGKS